MTSTSLQITMGEGRTPIADSGRIGGNLWFKLESCNPTGSYKDRFIAAEIARVIADGRKICVATSSGNTGASLASYCARYGLACVIIVNADAPAGKLMQMQAHGAKVLRIPGFVSQPEVTQQVFAQLTDFTATGAAALVVSAFRYCPVGMNGVKGIAREIVEQLPRAHHVFVQVGGGGLFAAVSEEMQAIQPRTRVHLVQPEGCATILNAIRNGSDEIKPINGTTRISGLCVPYDIDAGLALRLLRQGGGNAFGVTDAEVYKAQRDMLNLAGIYTEPAGATGLAGYYKAREQGIVKDSETSVCLVTGHGFKDPASIEEAAREQPGLAIEPSQVRAVLEDLAR